MIFRSKFIHLSLFLFLVSLTFYSFFIYSTTVMNAEYSKFRTSPDHWTLGYVSHPKLYSSFLLLMNPIFRNE